MGCTLIQGDCITEMQKLIDEGIKVDLVLTDPPYNISKLNDNRDRSNMDSPIMRRKKPLNYDILEEENEQLKQHNTELINKIDFLERVIDGDV